MITFAERLAQDRRLVILRALEGIPGYEANESVLHDLVGEFGHNVSRDQVRGDLGWLREQGLIEIKEIGALVIATATLRGCDVARGDAVVPGVKRPSPGA